MFEYLHNINTGIIENLDFYHLNYVFSIILVITFITITFNIGIPSVKRMLQNDKMYFRILLTMVVLDAVFSTMLVFYEIFAHQNIWGALMVIIIAMIVLLNSGGWLFVAYNMLFGAKRNPVIGIKMYLPMILLLMLVYISHIHLYDMLSGTVSKYVLFFWEWRSIITISIAFLRSIIYFFLSVFSGLDTLEKKLDDVFSDLRSTFFKD